MSNESYIQSRWGKQLVNRLHSRLARRLITLRFLNSLWLRVGIVDGETKTNKLEQAVREVLRLLKREARSQKRALVQEHCQVANSRVILVIRNLGGELFDDRIVRVNFHRLLRSHVLRHRSVTESLSLHDSFHVG